MLGSVAEHDDRGEGDVGASLSAHAHGSGKAAGENKPAPLPFTRPGRRSILRSEEHTSELQSLMRISYAVFCLTTKNISKKSRYIIKTQDNSTSQSVT